jgi:hypothetical protein
VSKRSQFGNAHHIIPPPIEETGNVIPPPIQETGNIIPPPIEETGNGQ